MRFYAFLLASAFSFKRFLSFKELWIYFCTFLGRGWVSLYVLTKFHTWESLPKV